MKKKILIFIDWYLPGYKAGGPVQSVSNMAAHLKDEFDFSIVTRNTDYCETESYKNVQSDQWNKLEDGTRVYYFSKEKLSRVSLKEIISNEDFEIAYLNGIFSPYFTLLPLLYLRKQKNKKVIIAARGMFAESALNVRRLKKKVFLFAMKIFRLFYDVIFHVTNEKERTEVEKALGKRMHIMVAGNLPGKMSRIPAINAGKSSGKVNLVNIARVAPEKNLLYALKILKKVQGAVQFDIYGPVYDEAYWKECLELIRQLPANIKVQYKGSLQPAEVMNRLPDYHFLFMPTRGENFGHIILQSLCAGVPVIISDQTPWNSLKEKKAGWAVPLELEETFVKVIDHAIEMDADLYRNVSDAACRYGEEYVSDKNTLSQNRQLFIL